MNTLLQLINQATSPYHTVSAAEHILKENHFEPLSLKDKWSLKRGGKYFVSPYDSSLFAFTVGEDMTAQDGFRISAAHGDFPGFAIKPDGELQKDGYVRLNVEPYGGVNYMSWLDRPLSVAGKVVLKSKEAFHPEIRFLDIKRPILTIPNVAIHMNREMNKGIELKCQTHMLPLLSTCQEQEQFLELVAEELSVKKEEILDYDLRIYCAEQGELVGAKAEFLSAPRLDNLTSVDALLYGLTKTTRKKGVNMCVIFDHEEIGSRSKQGAFSMVFPLILERIGSAFDYTKEEMMEGLLDSYMLSTDVAHGLHPAYTEKYDPKSVCILNKGLGIKQASSQSYASDTELVGVVQQLCDDKQIPYQKFRNHSDQKGGGTLGGIASTIVPVHTIDVGVPILAMHSSRELMGIEDQKSLRNLMVEFFSKM